MVKSPQLVDTHAHLNLKPLASNVQEVLERAAGAGIGAVINIGIDLDSSEAAAQQCRRFGALSGGPRLYFAAGIHPHDAESFGPDTEPRLTELLQSDNCVALGEIGLDYYRDYSPHDIQKQAFEAQLAMASELGLPVIIHDREAHEDVIEILGDFMKRGSLTGVFHCFSGDVDLARRVLDAGFYISFTGVITFPKAEVLRQVARFVPKDRMLIETDCPFLAPVPFRGKTNEPAYVAYVARTLAETKDLSFEETAEWTTRNAEELFGIGLR